MTGKWSGGGLSGLLVAVTLVAVCLSLLVAIAASAPAVAAQETAENGTDTDPEPDSSDAENNDSGDSEQENEDGVNINVGSFDGSDDAEVTDTIERDVSPVTRVYGVSEPDADDVVTIVLEVDKTTRITITDSESGYNDGDGGQMTRKQILLERGTHQIEMPLNRHDGDMGMTIDDGRNLHRFPIEDSPDGIPVLRDLPDLGWQHTVYVVLVAVATISVEVWQREKEQKNTLERVM